MRLAFVGQQRSGKDTAGEIFTEWVNTRFFINNRYTEETPEHYSLAAPLKVLVASAYGSISRDHCQGVGRKLRDYDENIWANILENEIVAVNPMWAYVSDVRYENEVAMLSKHNFHIIGISSPNEERYLRSDVTPEEWATHEDHESERAARAALLDAPYHVKNDGSMGKYRRKLTDLFEELHSNGKS